MHTLKKTLAGSLAAAALCAMSVALTIVDSSPAAAQDVPVNGAVNIQVHAIHATSTSGPAFASPALEAITPKLTKAFGQYSSFKQVSSKQVSLRPKASFQFPLPDANIFELAYDGPEGALAGLNIGIGKKFNTKVRASRGSTFFQAGLPYKGGILIIAISVE
jgi:hypothetical protein